MVRRYEGLALLSPESAIPNVGEISQHLFIHRGESFRSSRRKLGILRFLQIGTVSAINPASAGKPAEPNKRREMTMTNQNSLTGKLTAAASAFFISLVLIAGTVSTPQTANATTVTIGEAA
jgi:hypothetical protein